MSARGALCATGRCAAMRHKTHTTHLVFFSEALQRLHPLGGRRSRWGGLAELHGLVGKPELNGLLGTAGRLKGGRCAVNLEGEGATGPFDLKPAKLKPIWAPRRVGCLRACR